jgi:FAD/FMN-containing dehydrogenase
MSNPSEPQPQVNTDPRVRAAYSEGAGIYRLVPLGVAVPKSVAELQSLVGWARTTRTPLTARGAGSGIPGNAVGTGVIVDLRDGMPRTLEVDPVSCTAITSANITQGELNRAAVEHKLRLPPDPSSSTWATLGGMVATNAAGARSIRYGPVRPWVMGMEVVTGDGEVGWLSRGEASGPMVSQGAINRGLPTAVNRFHLKTAPAIRLAADQIRARFPKVRKNTAGYALDHWLATGDDLDLLIGAEGTLGFITTIRWRLDPVPAARSAVRIALRSLNDLEEAVRRLSAFEPSALELLDRTFLDLVREARAATGGAAIEVPAGTEALLLVEFERGNKKAARGAVGDAVRAVTTIATDVATALTAAEEKALWALRHAASPILASLPPDRRSLQIIEDGCVPLPRLGAYVRAIREAAAQQGITVVIFGHAGDGNVHVNALPQLGQPDWPARIQALYDTVNAAVIELGGTVSGEHGDGRLRAPLLEAQYGAEIVELFRRVKTAFDPDGILNPGVKLDSGGSALAGLKIGPDAAAIPEDIALALRQIERTGGYARSRMEIAGTTGKREQGMLGDSPRITPHLH